MQQNNGIYIAASGAWTRSTDTATYASLVAAFTFVQNGTTQANSGWACTIPVSGTLGVTPISWSQLSNATAYFAGTGLTLSSYTFSITPVGTAGTWGSASSVPVFVTNVSGQVSSVTNTPISIAPSQINATIPNSGLTNSSITVNGNVIALGGTATITANTTNALTIGTGLSGTSFNGSSAVTINNIGVLSVTGTSPVNASTTSGATTISLATGYGDTQNPYSSKTASYFLAAPNGTAGVPTFRAIVASDIPVLNQNTTGTASNVTGIVAIANGGTGNTTGQASSVANSVTFNSSGTGSASPATFNGSSAITVSYNTLGASPLAGSSSLTTVGTISSGTWNGTLIGVTYGGTGQNAALTQGGVIYAASTTAMASTGAGSPNQVLTSNGTGAPTWANPTSATTVTDDTTSNTTEYVNFARQTTGALTSVYTASSQVKFNPSTGIFNAPIFSGSGANLTSIPNSALTNSTISGIALGSNLATLTIGTGLSGTSYNGSTAVTIANTGVTSITGTASQITASASTGAVTLSLPSTINVNTSGNATTATNIANGALNQIPYQTASGTTAFITAPSTSSTYLQWNGTAFVWAAASGGSGSPGGSNTQVQYNSSGTFGGSSSFTWSGTAVTAPQYVATAITSGSSTQGAFTYGTLGYTDVNHILTMQGNQNSYIQMEIQNTNAGTTASADVIVANDLTTATTNYGDFGINSSAFTGTGNLSKANAVYLTATTGDLSLGTTTSNPIHFVIAGGTTDAGTIDTTGRWAINNSTTNTTPTALLHLGAGTATASTSPLKFTSGTNLTTAEAGAVEYDGVGKYFTSFGTSRGSVPSYQIEVLSANYTLTSQTAAQKLLNATTNGAVAVTTGLYEFECQFFLTGMSATSGTFGFALAGTATYTQFWMASAAKSGTTATAITSGTANAMYTTMNTAANTAITGSSTNTAGGALIKGFVRVTVAGTIIPQVSLSVASAAVVQAGSYFKITPVSATSTATTVGNWS